ncbi:uncharacterized protein TM35_000201800 [Trypanosoma theileri]|uniref:Uncharacterized protein n=1 Tax=Trypanosoma theileri TaxID=67003 RepID=A0A1X0NT51_9TRYP|nr:uncharacterized protein TM35_000201800 [Trypanosoma theileri]ORC87771.1 hypothetical protein TM35_000201800 [Trypanosoma theileri]
MSSLFLSRRPFSFFTITTTTTTTTAAPTMIRRGMRRATLPRSSLSSSLLSRGISTDQQKKKEEKPSEWKEFEDLTLRLQDQVGKIGERVSQVDTVLQQQVNGFSLMHRQQAVMERRIVALEEEAARTQQKIAETTRLASDVVLQHRNVEVLVQQMEKLVLKYAASLSGNAKMSSSTTKECEEEEKEKEQQREEKKSLPTMSTSSTTPDVSSVPAMMMTSNVVAPTAMSGIAAQISALNTRVEALQARVEQLTMNKLILDRVLPHTQQQQQEQQKEKEKVELAVDQVKAAAVSGCSEEKTSSSLSPKALATLLRNTGAFPFKDNTGTTRISSQKVLIRGVPVNFGAADVRDLASRVGNVITCVVRRIPIISTNNTTNTTTSTIAAGSKPPRYRSQQQEDNGNDCKDDSDNTENRNSSSTSTSISSTSISSTSTAAVKEEEEEEERAFEVTFQAVEQAVRAVLELDKHKLHGNYTISVEPVVAADILAALQQLERDSKKR